MITASSRRTILAALLLLGAVAGGVYYRQFHQTGPAGREPVTVFCAAGLKKPVEAAAAAFEKETGQGIALQYGGTGTLLSQIAISGAGDLFIAADAGSLQDAVKRGLVKETFPMVSQTPVIAVKPGNPLNIRGLDDLLRPGVRTALANPEAASIGRSVRAALGDRWPDLAARAAVMKPTVTEIAADLSLGAVDAAIVWDAVVPQFKLEAVTVPELNARPENATAAILNSCRQPAAALRFARFLTAPGKGGAVFQQFGFKPLGGDEWAAQPELLIYSGAVNRPALAPLLTQFADREGVTVNTVYNGCGVLCATLKTIVKSGGQQLPDAYFACDLCFVPPVADMFPEVSILTETEIGITVPKGNPRGVKGLDDLARPGLKLGIGQHLQSTLGFMTAGLLKASASGEAIRKNVAVEVPTADFLINQMRAGGLDAAIVYRVNVQPQAEHLEFISLPGGLSRAVQPFGVRNGSPHGRTAGRLLAFLLQHRTAFEDAGFVWRGGEPAMRSRDIVIPDWLKQ